MSEELFEYQKTGSKWLSTRKIALLGDEMGLGKSAQAIVASDIISAMRILVLCPAVARVNWQREFTKFATLPRKFTVIHSGNSSWAKSDSIICSYDMAVKIGPEVLGQFDLLILDEAHYLKSIKTKRTKIVFGKKGFVRYAKKIWALTGTPAPNNPSELWPLLYTFGFVPDTYERFLEKYCNIVETSFGPQVTGARISAIPELRSILEKVMLRRKTEDVIKDLPALFYNDIVVEPGPVDLNVESSFVQYVFPNDKSKELFEKLDKERAIVEAVTGQAGLGKDGMKVLEGLATSVSTLRRYTGLQKAVPVAELIKEELENNAYEKVVLFAIHRDVIESLRVNLAKFGAVTLYGGTPPEKRQKNIDNFQNNPKTRVFIGNIQAAGTAITLTASNQVVFVEQDWVPGNNAQAAKRCHRIGQTKPVFVRMVGLADSFDERIAQVLKRKARELTQIFDDKKELTQDFDEDIFS